MLNSLVCLRDDSIVADGKTVAECTTSECCACNGDLRVSLRLASPPESSFLCYGWTGRRPKLGPAEFRVIAAHGDSVLVDVRGAMGLQPLHVRLLRVQYRRRCHEAAAAGADPAPRPRRFHGGRAALLLGPSQVVP
jgi:hypothetical protein